VNFGRPIAARRDVALGTGGRCDVDRADEMTFGTALRQDLREEQRPPPSEPTRSR
jgi:hypothetical protein